MTAPAPRRTLPTIRWWHRWIGIAIGVLLFGWAVSGIIMLIPPSAVSRGSGAFVGSVDLSTVAVTPAQAAQIAAQTNAGDSAALRSITLRTVLGTAVYMVVTSRGEPVLVNATAPELFPITLERATSIAIESEPGQPVIAIERLTKPPTGYFGRMPVYRVALGDDAQTVAIVAETTGEMQRSTRRDRIMYSIGHNVHVFSTLAQLPGGEYTRRGSLIMSALIALLLALSGYWLSLPKRWFRRSRLQPSAPRDGL